MQLIVLNLLLLNSLTDKDTNCKNFESEKFPSLAWFPASARPVLMWHFVLHNDATHILQKKWDPGLQADQSS